MWLETRFEARLRTRLEPRVEARLEPSDARSDDASV